jgi:hypothetical protein
MASFIEQLNVSNEDRFKKLTPTAFRRHKLLKALNEQIEVSTESIIGVRFQLTPSVDIRHILEHTGTIGARFQPSSHSRWPTSGATGRQLPP